ncbi:MAG: M48 family metalloprotease [Ignavibacteria bacterium]|nr:M48 family metalloprotease [Ignavibacteria bacterium]
MNQQPSLHLFKQILRRSAFAITAAVASLTLVYCSSINMFPVSEDQKLGAQFDQEIRADQAEYPLLNNATANRYLQTIINTVLNAPEVKYRGVFPYRVEIINDDKIVNAFCTPGGYIYVYTGLIKMLDNEASIAGVLGHEIAHAERRHSTSRMTKAYGLQTMMDIALGRNPNNTVALAANAFAGLGLLKNSRSDEEEADDYSFNYLRSTVYFPGAIQFFFEKVKGRGGSSIERLLSSHPLPEDRIKATTERLKSANIPPPTEAQLRTREYTTYKRTF